MNQIETITYRVLTEDVVNPTPSGIGLSCIKTLPRGTRMRHWLRTVKLIGDSDTQETELTVSDYPGETRATDATEAWYSTLMEHSRPVNPTPVEMMLDMGVNPSEVIGVLLDMGSVSSPTLTAAIMETRRRKAAGEDVRCP